MNRAVGVSAHTLRYYEKIGLLKEVCRNSSGHRFYTSKDLEWVKFIVRLKDTGMPLEKITGYADLREMGDITLQQRQKLLEEHRIRLNSVIESQLNHLKALDQKITYYKGKISS
ncbi:MerR family transcriptional regulator [Photobacterium sp.]|uniref:MerR family transcriptional regulator n=1 Tax=Photobacterium sp. TaxID=660 RepID=UPI00299EF464|nr:MerR family transcriptional regulator [Photobacterium sp.]MDX1304510.1 MerR family transcriptional regulator [Photobacterium sp.]